MTSNNNNIGVQKTILVVDDDEQIHSILKLSIELRGYSYVGANTVLEGLLALKNIKPDVVILDMNFEDYNGMTFLQCMDAFVSEDFGRPSVIVLSSMQSKEIVDFALDCGAERYIAKPSSLSSIMSAITDI